MAIQTSKRARHKQRTRDALLVSARALFRAQGYDATTVDQIAAGAGVSRRTLFRYFPSKDALVFPHAEERLGRLRAILRPEPGEDPLDTLRRVFGVVARDFSAHRDELVLQQELIESSPVLLAREHALDRRWEGALAEALEETGPRERARIVAGALMGAVRAVLGLWFAGGGRADLEDLGEQALAILGGALAEPAPGSPPSRRQDAEARR